MKKKLLATIMALAMVVTAVTPQIFATVDETQSATSNKSVTTNVKYSQTSNFSVIVPKIITLDADKTSSYTVDVNGDIASDVKVVVIPDETVTMKDVNSIKADVTGTIEQDKIEWFYNEMDVNATGLVSAQDLTAGTWKGVFYFNINMAQKPVTQEAGLYDKDGNLLCTWEESGIDVERNYTNSTYKTEKTSGYYVLTNNYPTATKVVIPDGVTKIKNYAFYECTGLTNVTIPNGVISIGSDAFDGCTGLTSMTISDSVTNIGYSAFEGCTSLSSVILSDNVSVGPNAFKDCTSLSKVVIPQNVKFSTAGGPFTAAFVGCTNLKSVGAIGSGCDVEWGPSTIYYATFVGCTSLTNVEIPDYVTTIESYVFASCKGLTSITIPSGVTSIGNYAFGSCSNLTSVTFKITSGWYVGASSGEKSTAISSTDLANTSTAATYLNSTHSSQYWSR